MRFLNDQLSKATALLRRFHEWHTRLEPDAISYGAAPEDLYSESDIGKETATFLTSSDPQPQPQTVVRITTMPSELLQCEVDGDNRFLIAGHSVQGCLRSLAAAIEAVQVEEGAE
jgi:hypothetical protein